MKTSPRRRWGYILIFLWITFTVSLTGWWIYFGVSQLERLLLIEHQQSGELVRYQRMIIYEGATLILSLVLGAVGLFWLMYRERRDRQQIEEFFATFTHEIKTPLSSVRLQGEVLHEELSENPAHRKTIERLLSSVNRLSLQLENSLFLASIERAGVLPEKVDLSAVIRSLQSMWPEVTFHYSGDVAVHADPRCLESVMSNLVQNAAVHGKATELSIDTVCEGGDVTITLRDNGTGFNGDRSKLGRLFSRHYSGSGSGIGLYLTRLLMKKMGGRIEFLPDGPGFGVRLHLKSAV